MCGIAGVFYKPGHSEVQGMLQKIQHRDPDGDAIKDLASGTLGHRRLATIDVEGAISRWVLTIGRRVKCFVAQLVIFRPPTKQLWRYRWVVHSVHPKE